MLKKRIIIPTLACCLLTLAPASATFGHDEGDVDEGGEKCIDTRRIHDTQIIDSQNILFRMRDRTIYHNQLPRNCPGLRRGKTISYRTSLNRLCDIDLITVLENFGMGLSRGPSCGLGKFRPITAEEAQALRAGPDADIEPEAIEPAEPEEPEVEE